MDKAVVEGIHKIANAQHKKKGYLDSVSIYHTQIILEAAELLDYAIQEHFDGTTNQT